jgi:hypothetical protein
MTTPTALVISPTACQPLPVTLGTTTVTFTEWLPGHAPLAGAVIAADTETTLIDDANPWMTPTLVLMQAFDGSRGVFVAPENVPAFMTAHPVAYFAFHNAAFDLKVIQRTHERADIPYDIYTLVDNRQVIDTKILYQLLMLGSDGHAATGKGQSTLAKCIAKCLGIELPKDELDEDGDDIRTGFNKYLRIPIGEIAADALQYAAKDVLATHALLVDLMQQLEQLRDAAPRCFGYVDGIHLADCWQEYGPLTHDTQLRGAIVCEEMRANGIHIDQERREQKLHDLDVILEEHGRGSWRRAFPSRGGSMKAIQRRLEKIAAENPHWNLHSRPAASSPRRPRIWRRRRATTKAACSSSTLSTRPPRSSGTRTSRRWEAASIRGSAS